MDWEEPEEDIFEDEDEIEELEHSCTNSLTEGRLQQEYTRPEPNLELYRQCEQDIEVMSIDITHSNRLVRDQQGTFALSKAMPSSVPSSRYMPSTRRAIPF